MVKIYLSEKNEDFEDLISLPILHQKYYCIDYENIKEEISIEGLEEDEESKFINILLIQCKERDSYRNYSYIFDKLISDVDYSSINFIMKEAPFEPSKIFFL